MGAARIYTGGTSFNASELEEIDFVQSADLIYFVHLDHPPQKLTRLDHTDWTWEEVAFGPTIAAPANVTATATVNNEDDTLSSGDPNSNSLYFTFAKEYAVAAVAANGQVSRLSATDSATNDLSLAGNYNTVTWDAVADADYYIVYGSDDGSETFGYMGRAEGTTFTDGFIGGRSSIAPDYSDGPRVGDNPFDDEDDYPSTVTFHQQRLMFARSRNRPNAVWGSQSADFENMDRSVPVKDSDALTFGIVSERVNAVNQLVSMRSLIALTSDAVFSITGGGESSVLTPSQIASDRQTGRGAQRLNPLVIDNVLFFRPSQGSGVRTLGYTFELDGYRSNDVSIFSPHFFDGYQVKAWAFQQEPYAAVWAVRDDGKLLCLTWEQEQQVWGWTLCDLGGFVEDVAVITEGGQDRVYLAVRRTLAGEESVFIERMALPLLVAEDLVNCCYLDCAVTQKTEEPTDTITGLWHLEGETVKAFADGYVIDEATVENGQVTLQFAASTITVGLAYTGEIETLPLALMGNEGTATAYRQMIEKVTVRVEKTRGIKVGSSGGELYEVKQRENEPLDAPIALKTGDFDVNVSAQWSSTAGIRVVQDYPLPATINALFLRPRVTK